MATRLRSPVSRARTAAVVVPFSGGAEVEQSLRARLLADKGWIELVDEAALTPLALAQAVDRADTRPPLTGVSVELDGAHNSAALLVRWIAERCA